jgi:ADP-heptose:LPS heptosyltransferase
LAQIKTRIAPATKLAQLFFNKTTRQKRSEVSKTEWRYNLDLLLQYDSNLKLDFMRPLLDFELDRKDLVIIHAGSGGSSDGNLSLDDYLDLHKIIKQNSDYEVIFTFGPDDMQVKESLLEKDKNINIKDDFGDILEFAKFISTSKLFISTSTGPMHLAGISDTPTISFFGDNLFASPKRWATISNEINQNNFTLRSDYTKETFNIIQNRLLEIVS